MMASKHFSAFCWDFSIPGAHGKDANNGQLGHGDKS
jgi:hypothetical protein